ncbi:hypothetical protein [Streptomyces hesseae]|uniref:Uncharacterized protein n=1 Tax=Streptomyces hesseae TaxID=3075519 RepID=A0ABU2SNZ9_9ACTN|nr:hypothetical protein [Streptomyces sp. DSM 40473]MDT0450716.1 hypothetical protein [Streptomyces sp. DSM 40473]
MTGAGAEAATQYLPPVTGNAGPTGPTGLMPAEAATQYLPPVPGADSAAATQYLPPVVNERDDESAPAHAANAEAATTLMPPVPPAGADPAGAIPAAASSPAAGSPSVPPPAEPTTSTPTPATPFSVMARPGERPPPAEFDTLFRSATPTQQLPPVPPGGSVPAPFPGQLPGQFPGQPQASHGVGGGYGYPPSPQGHTGPQGHPGHQNSQGPQGPQGHRAGPGMPGVPGPPAAPRGGHDAPRPAGRKKSPAVVIAAVVAGCAVAGLGAGALLSGGDDNGGDRQNAAAASPATSAPPASAPPKPADTPSATPSPSAKTDDPAAAQAKALDALLKDSNNSRDAVIKAVDSTRSCKDLDKSAADLTAAAGDRNALVGRLGQTPTDKLSNSAALTAQLTKAWQSSASADSHYAAWARQAKDKKGCVKDHARPTRDSVDGDRASADATAAKKKAADLWNPIARQYGLTPHDWTQL